MLSESTNSATSDSWVPAWTLVSSRPTSVMDSSTTPLATPLRVLMEASPLVMTVALKVTVCSRHGTL